MSFYQKYRPRQFGDIVGQDQVIQILKNQARLAPTTTPIFSMEPRHGENECGQDSGQRLNCESLDSNGEPCGKCQSCEAVIEGRHWDVLEIDGARFRGIDDIKDLCYKAYFSPMGKKKVYIIDECHQLTEPAWAALLKLIEEPPPHLVIILCTTARDKVPDTIASRCQLIPLTSSSLNR